MNILEALKTNQNDMPASYKDLSADEMERRVREIKQKFGKRLFIPGHHYQKDEVIQFANETGDSLQLAQVSAENKEAEFIVFCGVHFMAETADILTDENQKVILPDMRAGCSMADMADIDQTERSWEKLQSTFGDTILPLTYVNSTAAIKSFVGKNGGATVTSSNAKKMVSWAFTQKERILFLPDQHLGRNTAYDLGVPLDKMAVWNPITDTLEYEGDNVEDIVVILWKGHCSVHENFTVKNIEQIREEKPDMNILVHPECSREVVALSDYAGSTKYIIDMIKQAPKGSKWAIGTEMNLVKRLIDNNPDKEIVSLNPYMCPCLTMNRIDLPHLLWTLEELEQGNVVNQIAVDETTAKYATLALDKMLQNV
ncbi:quinolinate synthase NadA [Aquibacillus koreensis]|uniref:Quinolinate synthase n=1 Tax=Aquibacillus koreensis TaxID=279446 RepID=A0A9X3WG45_9BACI|nr:quinolinate synthase NadA [Aquibacillus koreensis]MCT2537974.1 quinolinate synthase NadA [Aquibacillus koreensis]MDC3419135.1 quinolinate synthase NadA [Aquibacillus koreensis]